jgi:acetylornithine deacetylase
MRPVEAADADYVKRSLQRFTEDVLLPAMQAVDPETRIDLDIIGEVAGLAPTRESEARDVLMELTGANDTDLVAFGTEAGLFQEAGMSVVVCGPGSIEQAHKPDEYVEITQLEQCLTMLDRLAGKLAA